MMTVETKNKVGLIGFVIFFLCLGSYGVWAYWPRKPVPQGWNGDAPRRNSTENASANTAPENAQRQAQRAERQAAMDKMLNDYIHASPQERLKIVDAAIDARLARQEEWSQRQAAAANSATAPATAPANAAGPGGNRDPLSRYANRLLNGNPQHQAAMAQFFQDIRSRMQQRNISMPSRGPGR